MAIGFVTCVRLGYECLEEIDAIGGKIDVVVTLKEDTAQQKSGRVFLDTFCDWHGADLLKVRHINDEAVYADLARRNLDWLFVVGWSQLIDQRLIALPKHGCIGMHPTLLPEGRGRAPIPWAILKGLARTGVTAFRIADGTDDGPVCAQIGIDIASRETATSLYEKACAAHRECIRRIWPPLAAGTLTFVAQDENRATYWPQRRPQDGELLASMTVAEADRLVRAVAKPYPGAWLRQQDRIVRVWEGEPLATDRAGLPGDLILNFQNGRYAARRFDFEHQSDSLG